MFSFIKKRRQKLFIDKKISTKREKFEKKMDINFNCDYFYKYARMN